MIMTTVIIRQKLVEYMKIAEDKKVKAIFSSKKLIHIAAIYYSSKNLKGKYRRMK